MISFLFRHLRPAPVDTLTFDFLAMNRLTLETAIACKFKFFNCQKATL